MDYLSEKHKKATLRANALARMTSVVSCDWAKVIVFHNFNKTLPSHVHNALTLLDLAVEDEMKELYNILKEYYA